MRERSAEIEGVEAFMQSLRALRGGGRALVALAGPAGAGKSTLAASLAAALEAERPGSIAVLGLDGFHYDDAVLEARGLRARKGAPETFDVAGFAALLDRLKANAEPEIAAPVFDRRIEIARAGAAIIPASVEIVLVEGAWLLLDRPPWRALRAYFSTDARIEAPLPELARRLAARWEGLGLSPQAVAEKLEANDLPNARLASTRSAPARHRLVWRAA